MSRQQKDVDDLDEIYPQLDFSEEEQQEAPHKSQNISGAQPRKLVKKQTENQPSNPPKLIAPAFLGGGFFNPPPPPPPSKSYERDNRDESSRNPHFPQRQRKNTIYVKNIPKNLNKFDKLMTFFRNYGGIKNIKPSEDTFSALIRFEKQQDALRFVNSQALVFNRPYIAYDTQQNFEVPVQKIKDREKQEINISKPVEKQAIILRESTQTLIADKYRCLLFLKKHDLDENLKAEIDKDMNSCKKLKQSQINDQEANNLLADFTNDYDWTLVFSQTTTTQIEKKKIIHDFNKYGPIASIHIKLMAAPESIRNPDLPEGEEKLGIIKLKFLGVRSSWEMYKEHSKMMRLEVEGQKLNGIYQSWQLVQSMCNIRKIKYHTPTKMWLKTRSHKIDVNTIISFIRSKKLNVMDHRNFRFAKILDFLLNWKDSYYILLFVMNEENLKLEVVEDLSSIFPDIEGELCSKHSSLMGKLKLTFNQLYDNMEPSHFIVVKGISKIIENQQVSLSMALENGIILMVTRTFQTSNIYLNGNHIDEQVIFTHKGSIEEGLHELNQGFEKAFSLAIDDMNHDELFGGIVYIHANIPQDFFQYRKSILLAFYISILLINNQLDNISVQKIIEKLMDSELIPDPNFLEHQFYDYQNRQLCLMAANQTFNVPLDPQIKFVFCRLGLANSDIRHIQSQIQAHDQQKQALMKQFTKNYGFSSLYEAFVNQIDIKKCIMGCDPKINQFIDNEMLQMKGLCQLSNQQLRIEQLIQLKWELDKKIFPEEVLELVEELREKTNIKTCMVVEKEFLLLAVDRRKYAQLICMLRQLLHKGELKSKSCFKIDEQLVQDRWKNDEKIGQKIFASAPSAGVRIFNPAQAIWFD